MSKRTVARQTEPGAAGVRYRPLYARALGLRHLQPGGMLCFVYLEGAVALSLLLALAELVSWWVVLILPVSVALMVKVNDLVAGAVARSAARTPERERERVRREVSAFMPVVGRASVVVPQVPRADGSLSDDSAQSTGDPAAAHAPDRAAGHGLDLAAAHDQDPAAAEAHDLAARHGHDLAAAPSQSSAGAHAQDPAATEAHDLAAAHAQDGQGGDGDQHAEAAAAGRRDATGRYAAAGQYLDAAWRQHAYAMAHQADHADHGSQRERQSASRRYE